MHTNQHGAISLQNKKSPNHWLAIKNGHIVGNVRLLSSISTCDHVIFCYRVVEDHFVSSLLLILVRVCVCAYVCACVRACVYKCACMHTYAHLCVLFMYMCVYTCRYVCLDACMLIYVCLSACASV